MAGKIITIDWPTIAALPSDEYHIKLLNKQQAAVLQALCEYQHWETRWDNLELSQDELTRFMGDIEYRLMGDDFMATVDDISNGICDGLECAFERIAARYLSGNVGGFSVGDDGEVTSGEAGAGDTVELPEDDPTTVIDEAEASRAGGMYAIAYGVNAVIGLSNTYFGADATADMTPTDAAALVALQYKIDETLMIAALTDMWAIKGASLGAIAALSTTDVASSLFCRGLSYQSINRVILAVTGGISVASKQATAAIVSAITLGQFGDWYEAGVSIPTTLYKEFSCVPSPTEIIYYTALGVGVYSQTLWKPNHRLLITGENYFTDADADTLDMAWYNDGVGVPQNRIGNWFLSQGGVNYVKPTSNQIPYSSTHKYQFTIDTPNNNDKLFISLTGTAGMNLPYTPSVPAEGIKITIEDLGEVLV